MPSHRSLRIAEAIREVVASAILFEVADPRVKGVTVLRVEVSNDLHFATVYVSAMGTANEQETALRGLKHAAGFLQARVAARLQIRFTPALTFRRDDSVKKSIEMAQLIDDALAADRRGGPPPDAAAAADDDDTEGHEDVDPGDESGDDAGRTPNDPSDGGGPDPDPGPR